MFGIDYGAHHAFCARISQKGKQVRRMIEQEEREQGLLQDSSVGSLGMRNYSELGAGLAQSLGVGSSGMLRGGMSAVSLGQLGGGSSLGIRNYSELGAGLAQSLGGGSSLGDYSRQSVSGDDGRSFMVDRVLYPERYGNKGVRDKASVFKRKDNAIDKAAELVATSPALHKAALVAQGIANSSVLRTIAPTLLEAADPLGEFSRRRLGFGLRDIFQSVPEDAVIPQNELERAVMDGAGVVYDTLAASAIGGEMAMSPLVMRAKASSNKFLRGGAKAFQFMAYPGALSAQLGAAVGAFGAERLVDLHRPDGDVAYVAAKLGAGVVGGVVGGVSGAAVKQTSRFVKTSADQFLPYAKDEFVNLKDGVKLGYAYVVVKKNPVAGKPTDILCSFDVRGSKVGMPRGGAVIDGDEVITQGRPVKRVIGSERNYGMTKDVFLHGMSIFDVMKTPRILRKNMPSEVTQSGKKIYVTEWSKKTSKIRKTVTSKSHFTDEVDEIIVSDYWVGKKKEARKELESIYKKYLRILSAAGHAENRY